jgi:hypothetical protein
MPDVFKFTAEVWEWESKASWFFVSLPPDLSEELEARFGAEAAGFGSLRVEVTVGNTTWKTSVFPDKSSGILAYALPLKQAVRKAEGLEVGASANCSLKLAR